jgi:tetratricopeptide (TPR) repeat protein
MKILKNYVLCLLLIALTQFVYAQKPTTSQDTEKLKVEELKLFEQKNYDQALKIAQQIAQIKEKELGSQHIEFAKALRDIATIQATSGKEKKAESTIRQAISIFEAKTDLTKEQY